MVMIYPFMVCGSSSHLYRIWVTIIPNSEYRILVNISANICVIATIWKRVYLTYFHHTIAIWTYCVMFFHNVKSTIKSAYSSKSNCVPTNSGKTPLFSRSLLTSQSISDTLLCVFNFIILHFHSHFQCINKSLVQRTQEKSPFSRS